MSTPKPAPSLGPIVHARVELGSVLVSLLEPLRGHEVEFHRWYERDHFYAGCMMGPYFFSGRRYVATRPLKDLRFPEKTPLIDDIRRGSYLALYWIQAGFRDEAVEWAVAQVNWLNANDRMLRHRAQAHAGFYHYRWQVERDADGVPPELALEHPFAGVVMLMVDRNPGVERDRFEAEYQKWIAPRLIGTPAALCIGLEPEPLPDDAPAYVARPEGIEHRSLQVFFLQRDPRDGWDELFSAQDAWLREARIGRVSYAAPFIPTIPGSDRYADELW